MELITYKSEYKEFTYHLNEVGAMVYHGEYKDYHYFSGNIWEHSFRYKGSLHGEYKCYGPLGALLVHGFYINDVPRPYVEMNEQEKLLFQIQHPGFRFIEE